MPSITFSYSIQAATRIKEANDYLNSLSPADPPVATKKRFAGFFKAWVLNILEQKASTIDEIDRKALRDILNGEVDIS